MIPARSARTRTVRFPKPRFFTTLRFHRLLSVNPRTPGPTTCSRKLVPPQRFEIHPAGKGWLKVIPTVISLIYSRGGVVSANGLVPDAGTPSMCCYPAEGHKQLCARLQAFGFAVFAGPLRLSFIAFWSCSTVSTYLDWPRQNHSQIFIYLEVRAYVELELEVIGPIAYFACL